MCEAIGIPKLGRPGEQCNLSTSVALAELGTPTALVTPALRKLCMISAKLHLKYRVIAKRVAKWQSRQPPSMPIRLLRLYPQRRLEQCDDFESSVFSFNKHPMPEPPSRHCYHCDLDIDPALEIHVPVLGQQRAMCCEGCAAVTRAIVAAGLQSYYKHRTENPRQGETLIPEQLRELHLYDHPDVQKSFVQNTGEHIQQAALILEGITCAACVWLNQQHLSRMDGVLKVEINYTSLKANVQWDERKTRLSEILKAIQLIGYTAHPYDPNKRQVILEKGRKDLLKRLGVAGGFGMQVMALSISLYLDDGSMDASIKLLIQRAALILTLPVIFYAAQPFFSSALKDLSRRHFGMDTPVALGISLAFLASIYALIVGHGEIYFDSVCMFSFLLLGARYLEISARKRAADSADIVSQAKPVLARKLKADGSIESLPALELAVGDQVVVHAGDTVPADALVISGNSSLDESILTGESLPQLKQAGDALIGGSMNVDSPITAQVTRTGGETVIFGIQQLLDKAQQAKPAIAQLADKISGWFVLGVLSLATLTGLYWFNQPPHDWLAPTIAVLIVSCPCALSLATPASITTAIGQLMKNGIVVANKTALESLHKLDVMFFDKTGTLTAGKLQIQKHQLLKPEFKQTHFAICSAIEQHSEHPIARAFTPHETMLSASQVQNTAGAGLSAAVDQCTYHLGTPAFVEAQTGQRIDQHIESKYQNCTQVILANAQGVIAIYGLTDSLRPQSAELVAFLKRKGIQPIMLTGDHRAAAMRIAAQVGIEKIYAGQLPADKLHIMKQAQQGDSRKQIVGMVGDGVNDAAVLAGADCAIATQGAAALSGAASDIILLTPELNAIEFAINIAHKTHAIIKQNLLWAVGYNLLAIPAAAMGYVPPWLAAIGMSLSSLLVVLNALRLKSA